MSRAVKAQGIECPIIREGDNIVDIVVSSVLKETTIDWSETEMEDADMCDVNLPKYSIQNKSVIGITESLVARAAGQYITVDDIATDIEKKFGKDATICLVNPIYSRNRFSMILKGIARAAKKVIIVMPDYDEVGNPKGVNPFTGVNIEKYYKELCESESCECETTDDGFQYARNAIYCGLHHFPEWSILHVGDFDYYTLADICSDKSPDWGVLGTNKATEERLKLFPSKAECQRVCEAVKEKIKEKTGKDVIVCVYGDKNYK